MRCWPRQSVIRNPSRSAIRNLSRSARPKSKAFGHQPAASSGVDNAVRAPRMSTLSAILLGMMIAWTPIILLFVIRFWKELSHGGE
jgi:hypothetical protein